MNENCKRKFYVGDRVVAIAPPDTTCPKTSQKLVGCTGIIKEILGESLPYLVSFDVQDKPDLLADSLDGTFTWWCSEESLESLESVGAINNMSISFDSLFEEV